ncbi:MAG: adenylate kinase family protein [Candidatus Heimdallarchaeota archaeon]|nr:adenylate kinase family protein [Candidatus Heimdallarchaeota archaeon]
MTDLSRVILLSGTPGVGKTTVSKLLESKGFTVLNLNELILKNGFYFGYDHSRESVIIDEELLISYLSNELVHLNTLLIIEGHTAEIVPKEFVKHAIVLRCNPHILRLRLQSSRDYTFQKVEENVQAEIMDQCLIKLQDYLTPDLITEIDTTNISPEQLIKKVELLIRSLV